jgi:c-di-GMP-binding flagellar brake protein YcgR
MEEKGMKTHIGIVNLERRKHPRFEVDLPIEYYKTDSSIGHTGRLMNTSEGGLLIYLPEQIKIGQHLKMKLFLSFGVDLNIIEILTEVVWEDIHYGEGLGGLSIRGEVCRYLPR